MLAACVCCACGPTKEKNDPAEVPFDTETDAADGGQITNLTSASATSPDSGADDTGGEQVVEDACLLDPEPGYFGYIHQCGGYLNLEFGADVGDDSAAFDFGQGIEGDFYAVPKVMACCDPFLDPFPPNPGFWEQPHGKACVADLVEQGCKSFVFKLQEGLDGLPVGVANQFVELSNWVASEEGQAACHDAFWVQTGAADATVDVDLLLWDVTWQAPNDPKWSDLGDPFVRLIDVEILAVYPTEDDEEPLLECLSSDANNDVVFVEAESDASATLYELASGRGSLTGPKYNGQTITGSGTFASSATSCTICSSASTLPWGNNLLLQTLELRSSAPIDVGTSTEHVTLERYWTALYEPVVATRIASNQYRIPPGQRFLLSTTIADDKGHIVSAKNSTAITITVGTSTTTMSSFQIAYTDVSGAAWRMTVNSSSWRRP